MIYTITTNPSLDYYLKLKDLKVGSLNRSYEETYDAAGKGVNVSKFLDKLNIINYKISNSEHIWNLVYLDGKWYHLDLTWDDPISDVNINRDTYFLITTSELEELNDGTHKFDKSIYTEAK